MIRLAGIRKISWKAKGKDGRGLRFIREMIKRK
jgi:hypothetical protein